MRVAVLSAYQTEFGELWNKSLEDLFAEAAFQVINQAGIGKEQIGIAFVGNKLSDQNHLSSLLSQILEIDIPIVRTEAACASGGVAVSQACSAIESGQYEVALVVGVEKMTDLSAGVISAGLMSAASFEERKSGLCPALGGEGQGMVYSFCES